MSQTAADTPLTGVVLVTHADYGASLLRAAEMILGPQTRCATVGVDATAEVGKTLGQLKDAVAAVDTGSGVMVLTDMFGGTPTNLSLSLLTSGRRIEVVTGISLPMLLKVLTGRAATPEELARTAKTAGVQGIVVAGEMLRKKTADG